MQLKWLLLLIMLLHLSAVQVGGEELDEELDELELELELDSNEAAETGYVDLSVARARNFLVDLNEQNAERILSSHEYVFLLGYATWCTRSSELMPEFASAASVLASSVLFAKLDAVANPKTAALYNIKGFPTLLFLTNGSSEQVYNGGDTKEEIVNWIRKRTGSPVSTLWSREDAEKLLQHANVFVGGVFDRLEGQEHESFIQAARQEASTQFVQTTVPEIATFLHPDVGTPPSVWIQKSEPERFVSFAGSFTAEELLSFVELNKYPLVMRLTSKNSAKINHRTMKLQVLLFAEEKEVGTVLPIYQDVAAKYKGKIMFLLVHNSDVDLVMPFLSMYGLQPGKPLVVAFNYENGQKYLLEKDINTDSLQEFCIGLLAGTRPRHYKSQSPPAKKKGYLQIVVGRTFEAIVLDETKDVFLQVTSQWCAACEAANKTIEKLASALKNIPSVVIAQFDASLNEHPGLQVTSYPIFLFYTASNKNEPISVPRMNSKGFMEFIHKHASIQFTLEPGSDTKNKLQHGNGKDEL